MALIPVFYTASTKDVAEKSHEQGILKYPGICWIQDIETVVYVSSDNELHYAKGNEQIDKVMDAVSGHLPALNDDGSLVDSGKSVDDFEVAGAAETALTDAKSYINKKISELINGAPETADTLKELSDLISQNKDVITSLDTLVSKKADITAIPTALPNPNALTFSGLLEGNYDGSEAVSIEVPQDMWIHVTIDSLGYISERDATFEEIDNYYTSHPSNNIFMSCLIDNIECIGTLESASPGNSYRFGVMPRPTAGATVYGITKKIITIDKNNYSDVDDVILSIPSVSVSGGITFEKAVCELLAKANIGYVIYPGDYGGGDYYLVIKTNFDRGRGICLVYDSHGTFKSYRYTLMNGEEWTITPYSPNIITIKYNEYKDGKYRSSHNFNTIKEMDPGNMLVCFNDAYGRLVSMDDNKAVFKILKSTTLPFDVHISINSDNSVEVKPGDQYAYLNENGEDRYTLDLSNTFMDDEFAIVYYASATETSYLGRDYKSINDQTISRIWLSETEIMDVTLDFSTINADTNLSKVPVTVEKKTIVPESLPNPNKLKLNGLVSTEYDGSSEVSVDIPSVCPVINIEGAPPNFTVESGTYEKITNLLADPHVSNIFASITYDHINNTKTVYYGILQGYNSSAQYVFRFFSAYAGYDIYEISKNDTVTYEEGSYLTQDEVVMDLDQTYEFDWGRPISVMVAKALKDSIPPADLVVNVTTTDDGGYQCDTTFEQICNASGDVRLILKQDGQPDIHGNLMISSDDSAVFKITPDPFINGYVIINAKNAVNVMWQGEMYVAQISKLNNTYTCDTTFDNLLEKTQMTPSVYVKYDNCLGYLENTNFNSTTPIAFNVIKDNAIVRILIDNTNNVTVKETPLGSNSFIVKVTSTFSNGTYNSDHSFSEIKEAYDKGLNPIVIYGDLICQMVYIDMYKAEFINYSHINLDKDSCKITIDESGTTFQTFTLITSNQVIPDLDRVLDTMDPIYPSSYPVSAQAIGKLRDSIKESIPTQLSQLESRDYDSLENKPIVSINDLIDGDKFTYTETKPNAQGFVTRTYKFIINPDLDFNDRLFRVAVPDNVGSIIILIVTKKTDGSDYLTYYIMGAANGEILAINTNKANKMMVVNRIFTGSRMLIEFDDTGCYKNSTPYFSIYKSDVLTKTNTVEFTPTEDYHPATKKYVDDTCEEYSSTARVEKTSSDTTAEIEPNKLYVFPEMASLTYTLATPEDTSIANEYHFVFRSGATATELVNPSDVNVPDGFTVDANKVYEVSILEGCMTYQSWAVS